MSKYVLNPTKKRFASTYKNLLRRCYPNGSKGKRNFSDPRNAGISKDWLHKKSNFIHWCMSQNPPEYHYLVQIDKNKPYGPDNCTFVPVQEKAKSLPTSHLIEYKGAQFTLSDLIRKHSVVSRAAFMDRLRRGFTIEEALITPSRKKNIPIKELQSLRTDIKIKKLEQTSYRNDLANLRRFLYVSTLAVRQANKKWKLLIKQSSHKAKKLKSAPVAKSFIESCDRASEQMKNYLDLISAAVRYQYKRLFGKFRSDRACTGSLIVCSAMKLLFFIIDQQRSLINSTAVIELEHRVVEDDEPVLDIEIDDSPYYDLFWEMLPKVWPLEA